MARATARGKPPVHYHFKVFVYRAIEEKQFADSIEFDLVDFDPQSAIARAVEMAKDSTNDDGIARRRYTLRYALQCSDRSHVDGLEPGQLVQLSEISKERTV